MDVRRLGREWLPRTVLLVALAVVVAGCTPGESGDAATTVATVPSTTTTTTTTTTTRPPTTTTTVVPRPLGVVPAFDDDDEPISADFAVRTGTLPNGLTYYVRNNDRPGGRAQLRLAVKAGSVQEEADQHGVAHFLEHMLFNGTEKYPANDLIDVLQSFGSEFGPDINAYTSYEETVYKLNLPVDQQGLLETGLDVLREWASAATIDPEEVDLERGVLLEEWRLRSQSYQGRYFAGVTDALLGGTPYEGQEPLADGPALDATTPEALTRFYEDWYRTDNMAIVVVGDVDVTVTEQLIVDLFSSLESRSGPTPPTISTEPAPAPEFFILADPEYRESFVELNYALPQLEPGTVGALRQQLALDVAWRTIATRLEEDTLRGGVPFHRASGAANPLVRTQRSPGLAAFADPDELGETADLLLREIERVLIHGMTEDEIGRVVEAFIGDADQALARADTVQDATYADAYVENFLGGVPIPPSATEARLRKRLLEEMTVDQLDATFRAAVQSTEPFVIVVGPEDAASELPAEAALRATIDEIRVANIPDRNDTAIEIEILLDPPSPGTVADVYTFPQTNIEVGTFGNGATFIMFPFDVVEGTVVFGASSFGGWSLVDAEDATETQLVSRIARLSGLAGFDQVSLDRYLSDRVVSVRPFIAETTEGLNGSSSTEDLETMMQLIHLYMTEPRVTDAALGIVVDGLRPTAEDPTSDPQTALSQAVAELQYGDERFLPVPPLENLETFDLDVALATYEERFGDAADFVFVFAGDFDPLELLDLALEYIATLPGGDGGESYADIRTDRDPGVVDRTVEAGAGELGEVVMFWSADASLDARARVDARLLDLVVRQRLTERIREELSATYSPATVVRSVEDPREGFELSVAISADPSDLDRIVEEVLADLADLRANGPTTQQMEIAREQLVREYELFSNELLIDILTFYAQRTDENFVDVFERIPNAQDATRGDLRDLARLLVDPDDYILVRLVPEDFPG